MRNESNLIKSERKIKIGRFEMKWKSFDLLLAGILVLIYIFSPRVYSVTTGLYNQSTEDDQKNVVTAMGITNTEERFKLYFQWYNVVHELGHGLLYYNNGVSVPIVDEEQLVNDFAVAYWKYYGEPEKIEELYDIVNYAVEHVGTNYQNGVDYLKLGRDNSSKKTFNNSFFTFNSYGWFQFSSVKHSLESNKSLEDVLKEMGFKDFKLSGKETLVYDKIDEEISTKVINDAIANFKSWGLNFKNATHHFSKDPNMNLSSSKVKYLGLFEIPDLVYIVKGLL